MKEKFSDRLRHAWNAFTGRDPTPTNKFTSGMSYTYRPDRHTMRAGNERSIVTAVYNRIAIDVASIDIQHVRVDKDGKYLDTIYSGLNECLTSSANIDQSAFFLKLDAVMSMFDEGCIALVAVDTTINPKISGSYDIKSIRVGKILEWFPYHVRIQLYNEQKALKEDIILPKEQVAIIENPLYAVMNAPNSTLQRLIRKLNILDAIDEQSGSGKLDLIIQLPYVVKTEAKRKQAEDRRKDIETQLAGSKYGIAYTDGAERITQLNRPAENNLMAQIEYLTRMLYNQLGLTESVFDGTADEKTMLNYHNRTVMPILTAIVEEIRRKFLTKTARSQGQSIKFFRDPFKLVPTSQIADIADKLTRNAIASTNEIRPILGWKPSDDPRADKLENKNIKNNGGNGNVPKENQDEGEEDYEV